MKSKFFLFRQIVTILIIWTISLADVLAQSPGGVSTGLQLWYDAGSGASGTSWTDKKNGFVLSKNGNAALSVSPGDASSNWNPYYTFPDQITEAGRAHFVGQRSTSGITALLNPGFGRLHTTFAVGAQSDVIHPTYNHILRFGNIAGQSAVHLFGLGLNNAAHNPALWYNGGSSAGATYELSGSVPVNTMTLLLGQVSSSTKSLAYNGGTPSSVGNTANADLFDYLQIGGGNFGFAGKVPEILYYNVALDATSQQKVNTYLATKYGLTLAVGNYISGTNLFWDRSANGSFSSNIAGIARDDNGSLHQRQSSSTNAGKQVLISNGALAASNASATALASDNSALFWGDNGLAKSPTVAISGIADVNARFAAIWKVQNTNNIGIVRVAWPAGLTNLKLIQSSDPVIDASDAATTVPMSASQTIGPVSYNYADVTLTDGTYFTFAADVQAPGGVVTGLQLWLPAENYTGGSSWADASVNGFTAVKTGTIDRTNYINYNLVPSGFYGGSAYFRVAHNPSLNPSDGQITTFAMGAISDGFNWHTLMAKAGPNNAWSDGWILTGNLDNTKLFFGEYESAGSGKFAQMSGTVPNNVPIIATGSRNGTAASGISAISYNAFAESVNAGASFTASNTDVTIGVDGYGNGLNYLTTADGIMYNTALSPDEKLRVQTYLAIKYGITLGSTSSPVNYLGSTGATVWDASTTYQNNVAGIAHSIKSLLNQKQSQSINPGTQVLIGTTSLTTNDNATNTTSLPDGAYMIWGDNGLAKTPSVILTGISGVTHRFAAIWKVKNTNVSGSVRLAWPGLSGVKLIMSDDETFDGSDTPADMTGTININGVTYNYADVPLTKAYFTFAAKVQGPGGVVAGIRAWYSPENVTTTTWTDKSGYGNDLQKIGSGNLSVLTGSATSFNFNNAYQSLTYNAAWGEVVPNSIMPKGFTNAGSVFTVTKNVNSNGQLWSFSDDDPSMQDEGSSYWYFRSEGGNAITRRAATNTTQSVLVTGAWDSPSGGTNGTKYLQLNGSGIATQTNAFVSGADWNAAGGYELGSEAVNPTAVNETYYGANSGIAENVIYNTNQTLDVTDLAKINSYFAIKYGLTLRNGLDATYAGTTGTYQYINSAGNTLWDGAANSAFHNNTAGISRDDNGSLYQKQSISQVPNTNGQVTIGRGSIAATNAANTNTLTSDLSAVVWGDNGNTTAMAAGASTYATFTYNGTSTNRRMTRIWKVQNTAVTEGSKIQFPVTSVGSGNLTTGCEQYVLLTASDAGFTNGLVATKLTTNGSNYEADYTFPAGASYFTFAQVNEMATGTVYLPTADTDAPNAGICKNGGWKYYYYDVAKTQKAFAIDWNGNIEPSGVNGKLVYNAAHYSATGSGNTAKIMGRLMDILPGGGNFTANSGVKVRIFFDASEQASSIVSGVQSQSWFTHASTPAATVADNNGSTIANATFLNPSASGMEDGKNYVQFDGIQNLATFGYMSTTSPTLTPPSAPDLRPYLNMFNVTYNASVSSRSFTANVRNIRTGTTTTSDVKIRLYKPTSSSTITLTGSSLTDWSITATTPTYYELTTSLPIPATLTSGIQITGNVTIPVASLPGEFNFRAYIPNSQGGEQAADIANNNVYIKLIKQ